MTTRGTRTLVLGGVRSGKSGVGEALLAEHTEVRYIATGPTLTSDAEWVARVEEHRRRRDERYTTVETTDLTTELSTTPDVATLVDDRVTAGLGDRSPVSRALKVRAAD